MRLGHFIWIICAALVISCSTTKPPPASSLHTEGLHHKWMLVNTENTTQDSAYIDMRSVYKSGIFTGCRYFSFTPKFGRNNRILIANISENLSGCLVADSSSLFKQQLKSVYSYELLNNKLRLFSKNKSLVFTAVKAHKDEVYPLARKWFITKMINGNNEQLVNAKAVIEFTKASKGQAYLGCNKFLFNVDIEKPYSIKIADAVSTKMFCKGFENEAVFSKLLPLVNKYQIVGNTIKIFDKDDVMLWEGVTILDNGARK